MYLIAKTVLDGKEYIDVFPGKTGDDDLEALASVLLEEVDGKGDAYFYSSELDELGRVEMPGSGAPEPIIGFRATGEGKLETLIHSPYSGDFVTKSEYEYEELVAYAEEMGW